MLYLLSLSSVALWFAFIRYHRFHHASFWVKLIANTLAYLTIALAFAILITAPSFGSTPLCNDDLLVVIFVPFRFRKAGRILFLVIVCLVAVVWTVLRIQTWLALQTRKHNEGTVQPTRATHTRLFSFLTEPTTEPTLPPGIRVRVSSTSIVVNSITISSSR